MEQRSRSEQHESIARVAAGQNAGESVFTNGVSVHRMLQSVSFGNLRAILDAAKGQEARTFVGTVDGTIVVSVNFNFEPCKPVVTASKKRGRDPHEEAAEQAVQRVRRSIANGDDVNDAMLEAARDSLHRMLLRLRGASGEVAIESWGLSFKKPSDATAAGSVAQRPRLILSVRITPGVAVPLGCLFEQLGARCASDGMLTTQDSSSLASGFVLPLSDQARTAELHGQRALTLFATVAR